MSWGTCYKSSNNIHFNFPPLMNDSRNYSNYEAGASLDNKLKNEANIKTNSDYRKYLQNNADTIIKNNQLSACDECSTCPFFNKISETLPTTKPYIFDSILSEDKPYGYETSDLKNIYLTRQSLDAQMHAPQFIIPSKESNETKENKE
tara:strand:- start:99 stop:542 length:444 start_codon:yes stop_codon:yes gene_type:complete